MRRSRREAICFESFRLLRDTCAYPASGNQQASYRLWGIQDEQILRCIAIATHILAIDSALLTSPARTIVSSSKTTLAYVCYDIADSHSCWAFHEKVATDNRESSSLRPFNDCF